MPRFKLSSLNINPFPKKNIYIYTQTSNTSDLIVLATKNELNSVFFFNWKTSYFKIQKFYVLGATKASHVNDWDCKCKKNLLRNSDAHIVIIIYFPSFDCTRNMMWDQ